MASQVYCFALYWRVLVVISLSLVALYMYNSSEYFYLATSEHALQLDDILPSRQTHTAVVNPQTIKSEGKHGGSHKTGEDRKRYSIYGEARSLKEWKERKAAWRPKKIKLQTVLRHLNLTEEDAPEHLPLTLHPNYPYLLHNPDLCGDDVIDVLFAVKIRPRNFKRRMQFRTTIFNQSFFYPYTVRCIFLLGQVQNSTLQDRLNKEHRQYGDLLQGRFTDHYHNLTHKGVMEFNWITHHCPRVRYVFTLDDDVFVDTFRLLYRFLPAFAGHRRSIVCTLRMKSSVKIMRKGKWTVNASLFSDHARYPYVYCPGWATLLTGDTIPDLYAAAQYAPIFWIDDVYLYGILPFLAGNISFFGGDLIRHGVNVAVCMTNQGHNCKTLTDFGYGARQFDRQFRTALRLHRDSSMRLPSRHVS